MALAMAKRIIPTKAIRGHVDVDACVIWCIDPRFRKALWDFEKASGFKHIDVIKHPGGAKALAGKGRCKVVIMDDIRASIRLHNPKLLVPMFHFDCGAYKPLNLDGQTEEEFLLAEVKKAERALGQFGIPVQPVLVDFDKVIVL